MNDRPSPRPGSHPVARGPIMHRIAVLLGLGLILIARHHADPLGRADDAPGPAPARIKPVASTKTGLLLEPPLDLSRFTRQNFEAESGTVGRDRIGKGWTDPIVPLPPRPAGAKGPLAEPEVRALARGMREAFDRGGAIAVSDVGLISTQEDIVRKPMFNHVAAFAGPSIHAYLLVQKMAGDKNWGYFAIVQDQQTDPPTDFYAEIFDDRVKFEGTYCYRCHSSGPLAIHPAREDLLSDAPLLRAINRQIADQPPSRAHYPDNEKPTDHGKPLALKACTACHDPDAARGPLYRTQAHPIRILTDFGYMPPDRRLKPEELAELKAWLEAKP